MDLHVSLVPSLVSPEGGEAVGAGVRREHSGSGGVAGEGGADHPRTTFGGGGVENTETHFLVISSNFGLYNPKI